MNGFVWIENLARDIRFAFRQILRSPGFAVIAIFTLALGIGANAAIFSLVDAIILRPLPYPDSEELVGLGQWRNQTGEGYGKQECPPPTWPTSEGRRRFSSR
jgi:hypothetical protein